jgi:hypothetical protein
MRERDRDTPNEIVCPERIMAGIVRAVEAILYRF